MRPGQPTALLLGAFLLGVGSLGCYRPELERCRIRCAAAMECPGGFACAPDGFCHDESPLEICGTEPGLDARTDGSPSCSFALVDEFDDQNPSPTWGYAWDDPNFGVSVVEDLGVLTISLSLTTLAYGGVTGTQFATFREARLVLELVEITNPALGVHVYFRLLDDTSRFAGFDMVSGMLSTNVNSLPGPGVSYDPALHRFWALRETGGRLFFETSADGADFAVLDDRPSEAFLDAVTPTVAAGAGETTATSSVRLERLVGCP